MISIVKLKNKIKHLGDEPVYCRAISNNCVEGKWHLFFDIDKPYFSSTPYPPDKLIYLFGQPPIAIPTHHGTQYIRTSCQTLKDVKRDFDFLKSKYKTDYFWSVPLWLRFTAKESISGTKDSPAPDYPSEILNHFQIRKMYTTWD